MSGDAIAMAGVVVACSRGDLCEVECQLGALRRTVLARRSGRLVSRHLSVQPGDRVVVEVSPYDLSRGRITHRKREGEP